MTKGLTEEEWVWLQEPAIAVQAPRDEYHLQAEGDQGRSPVGSGAVAESLPRGCWRGDSRCWNLGLEQGQSREEYPSLSSCPLLFRQCLHWLPLSERSSVTGPAGQEEGG